MLSSPTQKNNYSALQCFMLNAISVSIFFAWATQEVSAESMRYDVSGKLASFDSDMLWGAGARSINVDRYSQGNPVDVGVYSVDISVNGVASGRYDVNFIPGKVASQAEPELTRELLETLGVDVDKIYAGENKDNYDSIFSRIENATYHYNSSDQKLDISIPQASLLNRPRGYVNPDRRDPGVNAAFIDYNTSYYRSSNRMTNNSAAYAGLIYGANFGNWRLRQRSSLNWDTNSGGTHQVLESYAQRDIDSISSQLTAGDTFTDGELFDSVSARGVRLTTDDRMLPDSKRGYAPVIRGVAQSNARVTIRQNGFIIQEVVIAPGAFEITDINPASGSGDLSVTVTEADGQEKTFIVPFSSVNRSLREGASRYTTTVGQARELANGSKPWITQATYQRGLNNLITGYTGVSAAQDYNSVLFGSVLNSQYGAFGADVTVSKTVLAEKTFTGQSARLTYNKIVQSTGTNFTVAAYRYSTDGYFGMSDALNAQDMLESLGNRKMSVDSIRHARSKAQLNISQNIGDSSYLYLNTSVQNYWNSSGTDKQFQGGLSKNFSWGSAGVSASRTQDMYGNDSSQYMFNISLPIGSSTRGNRSYVSSSLSASSDGSTSAQSTLSGSAGDDQALNYGISASHDRPKNSTASSDVGVYTQYSTSVSKLSASLSRGSESDQFSMGANGSVVAHPAGVTFGQPLGDSLAIIDAPEAAGASVSSSPGVRLDSAGQAVVPYLSAYRINNLEIDPKGISDDVELQSTSKEVVPRSGAIVMVKFATTTGRALLINARQSDGKALPFGAPVYDEQAKNVGVVGQGGQIFARVNSDQGVLSIAKEGREDKVCKITYNLKAKPRGNNALAQERLDALCED
ncbi:MAG: fimbrial biogenesis outer membrane usher protein [Gammaproteobacteria bacterium]|nr:fimbrial biogenesis outer membrane usher protein [Gammaproteobacteria bacterium]MBU0817464.1 fimbrial biogenesis outer membrane usher protein [Gammaproteobacteria bacterium]MBU0845124.1 fimbrial biogenesis outer membrane usher protein [Gammaproteobacteria bacterium]MBU1839861.1 fimbrial biogenesis outer membrane usher protein [Gammaproteobacteria bacterium]